MAFAHLHVHTEFSALDSITRVDDLFQEVQRAGQTAVAITDHKSLGAMWRAQLAADSTGVKLVPGIETYVAIGKRTERTTLTVTNSSDIEDGAAGKAKTKKYYHLTLLARNEAGWRNLVAIQNEGALNLFGEGAMVDWDFLRDHAEGLICLTGCLSGPVMTHLVDNDERTALKNLDTLQSIYGDYLFGEVMTHGIGVEDAAMPRLVEILQERDIHLVATNDSHFTKEEHKTGHQAWLCIRRDSPLANPVFSFSGDGYWLRTEDEMRALNDSEWWQDAVTNAGNLPELVDERVLPRPRSLLPEAPVPAGFEGTGGDYMQHLIREGLSQRFPDGLTEEIVKRVNVEWETISSMGFVDYFLIVHELISWAREQGILVGPGRGSAAGSLIAYALGITQVDPLRYGLLFERFLEPGRAELPDIDIDFDSQRRGEVIDHLIDLYGKDNVAAIGNVNQARSKQALKSAAKVLQQPKLGIELAKAVPPFGSTLTELLQDPDGAGADLMRVVSGSTPAEEAVKIAQQILDVTKAAGVHASGIIVSPVPLPEIVPMRVDKDTGRWVTEWDMDAVQDFGLVKIDILGLRNLAIVRECVSGIKESTGEEIDLYSILDGDQHDDERVEKAWRVIRAGRTAGLFQMESEKMTDLIVDIAPDSMNDLSAAIALFRPGPLSANMHTRYAMRKNNREPVSYAALTRDPTEIAALESVLGSSYGSFIYQEQVMQLGRVVAGFDDVWRSKLRKAVSKKNEDLMRQVGEKFFAGAGQEFVDEDGVVYSPAFSKGTADRLWEAMKGSAEYLFNASHSVAYCALAFATAYLKASWPAIYGASTLRVTDKGDQSGEKKRISAIRSLRDEGIAVLAPDVNESGAGASATGDTVRLGFNDIKGLGSFGDPIIAERDAKGPFESMENLMTRVRDTSAAERLKSIPADGLLRLIESGAMDAFGSRRSLIRVANAWAVLDPDIADGEFHPIELAARQRRALLTITGEHPIVSIEGDLAHYLGGAQGVRLNSVLGWSRRSKDMVVTAGGILTSMVPRKYAGNTKQALDFTLEDTDGQVSCIAWDGARQQIEANGPLPRIGWPVAARGQLDQREWLDDTGEVHTQLQLRVFSLEEIPF